MSEPEPKGSAEWYGWFLSDEQVSARRAKEEAEKAAKQPISRGELRDALIAVTQKMERESGYESSSVEGQIQEMAKAAVAAAFDALLEELGMDRWSE